MSYSVQELSARFRKFGSLEVLPGQVVNLVTVDLKTRTSAGKVHQSVFLGLNHPSLNPAILLGTDPDGWTYYAGWLSGMYRSTPPVIDPGLQIEHLIRAQIESAPVKYELVLTCPS